MLRLFESKKMVFILLFAVDATFSSLIDPDFYLHLMAGKYIVQNHSLPNVDVFSLTMAGQPWHMHEWLFEVMVYGVYLRGGERGVVLWMSGIGLLAFYLVFLAGVGNTERPYRAILFAIFLFIVYAHFIKPRPQIITFLCYAILLFVIFDYKYRNTLRFAGVLPPVMVLWANAHGAYIFGVGFLWLFIFCEYLSRWMGANEDAGADKLRRLTLIAVGTFFASAISPYFIRNWVFPFELMNKAAMGVISEWRSPDFHDRFFQIYLLITALFVAHYIHLKKKPDLTELLLPGSIIFSSFISLRHIPLAILTILAFGLVTAKRGYDLKSVFQRISRKWVGNMAVSGRDIRRKEYLFNALILFTVVTLFVLISPTLRAREDEERDKLLPVKAVDFILENGISGRFFNTYHYGGYLIYRLFPEQKVFVDTRADMYGDEFMRDYTWMYFGSEGWDRIFDSYNFDYVICENSAAIRRLLVLRGDFELAYSDTSHSVLLRKFP